MVFASSKLIRDCKSNTATKSPLQSEFNEELCMKIALRHGAGGEETSKLIHGIFATYFQNDILNNNSADIKLLNTDCKNDRVVALLLQPLIIFLLT